MSSDLGTSSESVSLADDPDIGTKFIAIDEHVASSGGELDFEKGDLVTLIRKPSADWWVGENDGEIGKFPSKKVARPSTSEGSSSRSPSPTAKAKKSMGRRQSFNKSGGLTFSKDKSKSPRKRGSLTVKAAPREGSDGALELLNKPHSWQTKQFNKFTWCSYCGEFIYGFIKQGLACTQCEQPIHRKCKFHVPPDCGNPTGSLQRGGSNQKIPQLLKGNETGVAHVFEVHHFSRYTHCAFCTQFIWGLGKQGYKCVLCSYPIHMDCLPLAMNKEEPLKNCSGRLAGGTEQSFFSAQVEQDKQNEQRNMDRRALLRNTQQRIEREMGLGDDVKIMELESSGDWDNLFGTLESESTGNIPDDELASMMSLIQKTEGQVKKLERKLRDQSEINDEYRALCKTVMVKNAEVEHAKMKITELWDAQHPDDIDSAEYNGAEDAPPPLPSRENPFAYDDDAEDI